MSDFIVPTGWKFHGANSGNQTIFTVTGHTVKTPYLVIFDRRLPSVDPARPVQPEYRVRVSRGHVDADGHPIIKKTVADLKFSWDINSTSSEVQDVMATLATVIGDADFRQDVVEEQLLPR